MRWKMVKIASESLEHYSFSSGLSVYKSEKKRQKSVACLFLQKWEERESKKKEVEKENLRYVL